MSTLRAFYDLKVSPCTYDIATFLYTADMYRAQLGLDTLDLCIVANDEGDGFRGDARRLISLDDEQWFLHHVLLRIGVLLPSCRSTNFYPTRMDAQRLVDTTAFVYPIGYSLDRPTPHYLQSRIAINAALGYPLSALRAPNAAVDRLKIWMGSHCGDRLPIVITLRELDFHHARNSDLKIWGEFAASLDKDRYCPIIVRDTSRVMESPPPELAGLLLCNIAAIDVEIRSALYQLAHICIFTNNGPLILARLNPRVRYIITGLANNSSAFGERYFAKLGVTPDRLSFPTTNHQRNVFGEPSLEAIQEEFLALANAVDTEKVSEWTMERSATTWMTHFADAGAYDEAKAIYDGLSRTKADDGRLRRDFVELIERTSAEQLSARNYGDAISGYRLLHKHRPENADYISRLIEAHVACRQYDEALDIVDRLAPTDATENLRKILLSTMANSRDMHQKYATLLDAHPDNYRALIRYAEILHESADEARAMELLGRAFEKIPPEDIQSRIRAKALMGV